MVLLAVVYAVASAVLAVYGLNLLVLVLRRRGPDGRGGPAPAPDEAAWPRVTVQLPLYNEPRVVERVMDAAARLDYPPDRLEIQVLDDSTDATRPTAAARAAYWRARGVDVRHLPRTHRTGFKAGALADGLAQARGELIAVFDADFVPAPDFLRRTVPLLVADPGLGLVQARWAHLNGEDGALTRVQAALIDVHFAIEQEGRSRAGLFMSFNGTAGVWRRACIEAAGGWQADTLTEDLDLSYRAQMAGWRFRFLGDVTVPAELPPTAEAWRRQQFRWTKGTAETARKLLGRLWRGPFPLAVKLEGTVHLGGFLFYPAVLLVALLHAPLALMSAGPVGTAWAALAAVGLAAVGGATLAHACAQQALYGRAARRLTRLPLVFAAPVGLAVSNTRAVWEALRGRRSAFERTPKAGDGLGEAARCAPTSAVVRAERALAAYSVAGLLALVASGAWGGVVFQALFALGFALVGTYDGGRGRAVWRARLVGGALAGRAAWGR